MTDTSTGTMTTTATTTEKAQGRRKLLIGEVVSTKMAKTIVVEVHRQKAHPFYKRVVIKIEETRPLSKLKRWQLKEIVRQAPQVAVVEAKPVS
jgi:small subunit ribosomal protein S17